MRRLRLIVAAAIVALCAIPAGVGATGAYFTSAPVSQAGDVTSATLPAPTALSVTRRSDDIYADASWQGVPSNAAINDGRRALTYQLERSSTADFLNPVTVYRGSGTSTPDAGKSAATQMINQTLAIGPTEESPVCALTVFRGVSCWGSNSRGQLGDGTVGAGGSTPVSVIGGLSEVSSIAVGDRFACAINSDSVYCWGRNENGQLGDGTTGDRSTPVRVRGLPSGQVPQALAVGWDSACVVLDELWCWGRGDRGQLGTGTAANQATAVRATVIGDLPVSAVAMGINHTCVLSEGAVYCVGANRAGQRGTGVLQGQSESDNLGLTRVVGLTGQQMLASSSYSMCAAAATTISCWGENTHSQLGTAASSAAATPVVTAVATGGVTVQSLTMSDGGGCVRLSDFSASCWGQNADGQAAGDDGIATSPTTVRASGATGAYSVKHIVRGGTSTCAVIAAQVDNKDGSALTCWGRGVNGQWGDGKAENYARVAPTSSLVTLPAGTVKSMVKVVAHNYAMCVIVGSDPAKQIGSVRCMGVATLLGTGHAENDPLSWTPETVTLLGDTVTDVSLGHSQHVCAVSAGLPYCWGKNPNGQLGVPTTQTAYSAYPLQVPIPGDGSVTQIIANDATSCALKGADVYCWGGGKAITLVASGVTQFSGMGERYCGVKTDAKVVCWSRDFGTPVAISIPDNAAIASVSVGDPNTCAVTVAGKALCWGKWSTTAGAAAGDDKSTWTEIQSGLFGKWCARKVSDSQVYCYLDSASAQHQDVPGLESSTSDTLQKLVVSGTKSLSVPKPWSTGCLIADVSRVICSGSRWSEIVSGNSGTYSSTVIYPTRSQQSPVPTVSLGCAVGAKLDTSDLTCSLRPGSTYYYRAKVIESVAGWRASGSMVTLAPVR